MLTPEKLEAIRSYAANGAATPAEYAVEMVEEIRRITKEQNILHNIDVLGLSEKLKEETDRANHYYEMSDTKSAERVKLLQEIRALKDDNARLQNQVDGLIAVAEFNREREPEYDVMAFIRQRDIINKCAEQERKHIVYKALRRAIDICEECSAKNLGADMAAEKIRQFIRGEL